MNFFASHGRASLKMLPLLLAGTTCSVAAVELQDISLGAAAWTQYGFIGKSSDTTAGQDLTGRSLISYGAQISIKAPLSEKLSSALGVGVYVGHTLAQSAEGAFGGYAPLFAAPYVSEANFTYSFFREEGSTLSLRGGLFDYNYNPDVKNLGLYLMRGPVYPGVVISGFETKHVLPVANMLGLQLRHEWGFFAHDLVLSSETELAPFYDLSLAYVAGAQIGKALHVGAGVNFYHLIPMDGEITAGEVWAQPGNTIPTSDTIGFAGQKLMANASFDPKAFLGDFGILGAQDLKIYGEVALIGLDNDSAHKAIYGDWKKRMPVMVGFNFPAFRALDHLSIEVEWYGSERADDLTGYNHTSGVRPSPLPIAQPADVTRDNWKWSVHGSRMLRDHINVSFQVANDHYRPGIYLGDGDNNPASQQAIFSTPKDFYATLKLAYFF